MTAPLWSPSFCVGVQELFSIGDVSEYILQKNAPSLLEKLFSGSSAGGEDVVSLEKDDVLGAACLMVLVQANWTGPTLSKAFPDPYREECLNSLRLDGELCYPLVKFPWLLVLAQKLLSNTWWLCRTSYIHQRLLDNPTPTIASFLESTLTAETMEGLSKEYGPELLVEAAFMMQKIGNQRSSEEFLGKASVSANFNHCLTGILGRRTKFQSFDVAQLTVTYQDSPGSSPDATDALALPQSVELNDEYLLDGPTLNQDGGAKTRSGLSQAGQAILLAEGMHVLKFYAKDATVTEKALALIQKILENPGDWCLYSSALFLRSQLESQKARLVERSALQYQALVDQISQMPETCFPQRAAYIFASPLPPEWELDRFQGRLFAGLGAYRTASNIFRQREMWDELIACLIQMGERQDAEELLNRRLQAQPNDCKLLCILGDLKEDHTLYEKAWEISGHRSSRAMRSLGMHYIRKDQVKEAIVCFEKALAINGLFEKIWFLLGCSAMQVEDWRKALHAFTRAVALDIDNSEAWNNLAAVHIHLGKQGEALRCLKEAGKRQYESGRIWENIFRVAMAMGDIMEAVSAYRRVCEIMEKNVPLDGLHMILEVLRLAVQTRGLDDPVVKPVMRQIASILDSVMATHLSLNYQFWYACAKYAEIAQQPLEVVEFYFKAYRAMQSDPVENDANALTRIVSCVENIKRALDHARNCPDYPERQYQLEKIVENLIQRAKANHAKTQAFVQLQNLADN